MRFAWLAHPNLYRNILEYRSVIEEDVEHIRKFSQMLITEQDFVDIGCKDADLF